MSLHRLASITIGVPDAGARARASTATSASPRRSPAASRAPTAASSCASRRRRAGALLALAIGVDDADDLARVAAALAKLGVAAERSERALEAPSSRSRGVRVGSSSSRASRRSRRRALALNAPGRTQRVDARSPAVLAGAPARPRRLSHVVIGSPDAAASKRFFTEGIGFRVSDEVPAIGASFMRCSTDHHNLLVQPGPVPFLHHTAWEMDDVDAVGRAAAAMVAADASAPRLGPRPPRHRLELLLVPARPGGQLRRVLERPRRDRRRRGLEGGGVDERAPARGVGAAGAEELSRTRRHRRARARRGVTRTGAADESLHERLRSASPGGDVRRACVRRAALRRGRGRAQLRDRSGKTTSRRCSDPRSDRVVVGLRARRCLLLAERTSQAVAVDLRGQGRSTRTPGRYTLDDMVQRPRALHRAATIGRPTLVSGLSSGGELAAWLSAYARLRSSFAARTTRAPAAVRLRGEPFVRSDRSARRSARCSRSSADISATSGAAAIGTPWAPPHGIELPAWMAVLIAPMAGRRASAEPEGIRPGVARARSGPAASPRAATTRGSLSAVEACSVLRTHHFRKVDEANGLLGALADVQAARVRELVTAAGPPVRPGRSPRWATPCADRTRSSSRTRWSDRAAALP